MQKPEPTRDPRIAADSRSAALSAVDRRRLLLRGVGRGSALLAVAAPLHSYASRNVVMSIGGTQCTVSGNQSAALSQSAGEMVCAGFAPTHFLNETAFDISTKTLGKGLNSALSGLGVGVYYTDPGNAVYRITSRGKTCQKLESVNWPSAMSVKTVLFKSIFTKATHTKTMLQVLQEGQIDAYFAAGFFNAYASVSAPAGFTKFQFDQSYIVNGYNNNYAATSAFLKLVCVRT